MARTLFGAMATGGLVGFETVAWFNGGLFDDDAALALEKSEIETTLEAAALDWSEIDPSILGTLFERGLDPGTSARSSARTTPTGTRSCGSSSRWWFVPGWLNGRRQRRRSPAARIR